jgi:hypothetical protein
MSVTHSVDSRRLQKNGSRGDVEKRRRAAPIKTETAKTLKCNAHLCVLVSLRFSSVALHARYLRASACKSSVTAPRTLPICETASAATFPGRRYGDRDGSRRRAKLLKKQKPADETRVPRAFTFLRVQPLGGACNEPDHSRSMREWHCGSEPRLDTRFRLRSSTGHVRDGCHSCRSGVRPGRKIYSEAVRQ